MGEIWNFWFWTLVVLASIAALLVARYQFFGGREQRAALVRRGQLERRLSLLRAEIYAAQGQREAFYFRFMARSPVQTRARAAVWRSAKPAQPFDEDFGGAVAHAKRQPADAWDEVA